MSNEGSRAYSNKMILIFRVMLSLLYMVLGYYAYANRALVKDYPDYAVYGFVLLCVGYGALRLYRAINTYQETLEN